MQLAYECFSLSYFYIFYWGTVLGKLWTFLLSFLCLLSTFLKINLGSLSCILGFYSQHSRRFRFKHGSVDFQFLLFWCSSSPLFFAFGDGLDGAYTYTHRDGILVVVRSQSWVVILAAAAVVFLFIYSSSITYFPFACLLAVAF